MQHWIKKPGPGYNALLLRLIPGDLQSTCPHRQFHTLPGLLDSRAALSNRYPNACVPSREAVCTIYMLAFGMTQPEREPAIYHIRPTRSGQKIEILRLYILCLTLSLCNLHLRKSFAKR